MKITAADLKVLAANSKVIGNQDKCLDLAIEFAEAAEAEIERLMKLMTPSQPQPQESDSDG